MSGNGQSLVLVGVNHKTAPIELRERVAIGRDELAEATRALAAMPGVIECMIVSTCNRVELFAAVEGPGVDPAQFLFRRFAVDPDVLLPHIYQHRDRDAVRHLFRVASSLDSMVVGEPQILGQVKEAFAVARAAGTVSGQLDYLLQSAFAAAKKIRSETQIGSNSVSIASVAVDLARKIFGSLQGRAVFLVGAGKMSELAARHLVQQGAGAILVSNRTQERAERMAEEFDGRVIPFEQLYDMASEADIVITSTGAPHPIFRPEHGQAFLHRRRNRPMFFIDIAVPRDVDPAMNKLEGIFVYDIDDLQQVAAAHMEERTRQAVDAESLVEAEVERFHQHKLTVNAAPAIVAMQQKAEEIRLGELQRIHARLGTLTEEQLAAVEALTRSMVNKFLHPHMQAIKKAAREGDSVRLDALCEAWSVPTAAREVPAAPAGRPEPAEQSAEKSGAGQGLYQGTTSVVPPTQHNKEQALAPEECSSDTMPVNRPFAAAPEPAEPGPTEPRMETRR
jgi:glutamyl-tRNA reductase